MQHTHKHTFSLEKDNSYHGQEYPKLWVHGDDVSVSKVEGFASLLLAGVNNSDLLGGHRQHWQLNAVELVKASPRTRLCKAWSRSRGTKVKGGMTWCIPTVVCSKYFLHDL